MTNTDPAAGVTLPDFTTLWDYHKPAETEARFRELLPLAESSGDTSYHASLLTQIARTQALQGRFDEAHGTIDQAEGLAGGEPEGIHTVRCLLERGRILNSSGNPSASRPIFERAYETASRLGQENLAIDAVHMIAIVEEPEEALRWNRLALELAEAATDPVAKGWQGSLYNNIAWTYMNQGEPGRALELFQKNVVWHTERNTTRGLFIAKWCVARALRELGRVEESLEGQQELLGEINEKKAEEDGFVYEEIGECLLLKESADEARPFFAKAYELLSRNALLARNEAARLTRLKDLGTIE